MDTPTTTPEKQSAQVRNAPEDSAGREGCWLQKGRIAFPQELWIEGRHVEIGHGTVRAVVSFSFLAKGVEPELCIRRSLAKGLV